MVAICRNPFKISPAVGNLLLFYVNYGMMREVKMLEEIVQPLLAWYDENHRTLPWREKKNPYHIWISEIMLQQTRVEAVRPYFARFIETLPTIHDLAVCPEDRLLKLWEGLGYYNRVRNMQKAAIQIEEQYAGELPREYDKLLSLTGIGAYTAGAVASIAFDLPVPAVDGNVLRIWARLTACEEDILKERIKKEAHRQLQEIMPQHRSGDLNQAFMDLGSMVCLPKGKSHCEVCPLRFLCQAREKGLADELPVRKKPKERRREKWTILVVRDGEKVAVHKRPGHGLLAGMYELPALEGFCDQKEVLTYLNERELMPLYMEKLEEAKHVFSHVEWHMRGYLIRVASLEDVPSGDWLFVDADTARREYPLPSAFRAYASYVNIQLGTSGKKEA